MKNTLITSTAFAKPTLSKSESLIVIFGRSQTLHLIQNKVILSFHISTGLKGFGEEANSFKTPRGWHYIRCIIGLGLPIDTAYRSRRPTKCASDISSRILWLCGLEQGFNHNNPSHSMNRYIYIHGTSKLFLKHPISEGCINMRNSDIEKLTNMLPPYCKVYIEE